MNGEAPGYNSLSGGEKETYNKMSKKEAKGIALTIIIPMLLSLFFCVFDLVSAIEYAENKLAFDKQFVEQFFSLFVNYFPATLIAMMMVPYFQQRCFGIQAGLIKEKMNFFIKRTVVYTFLYVVYIVYNNLLCISFYVLIIAVSITVLYAIRSLSCFEREIRNIAIPGHRIFSG